MMEKSSEVTLSQEEKDQVLGKGKLTKKAGAGSPEVVPERFQNWYSLDELKKIANEQN